MLQKKKKNRPNLYWIPCDVHYIDLILEDIESYQTSRGLNLERVISLNGYIYNHSGLLNMMRQFTVQRELLRLSKT